jgi:general secretion pathway protein D
MKHIVQTWIVLSALVLANPAAAAEETEKHFRAYPPVPLADILESVSKETGRIFLTNAHAPAEVVVGQLRVKDITYGSLLIVLDNNGLAAVTVGEVTNIVHAPSVRQYALPILHENDDSIAEYEWVTRIVAVKNLHAQALVPILRPMLPQMGHLVAESESNTILISGRYGNTKRLVSIINDMDARVTPQP